MRVARGCRSQSSFGTWEGGRLNCPLGERSLSRHSEGFRSSAGAPHHPPIPPFQIDSWGRLARFRNWIYGEIGRNFRLRASNGARARHFGVGTPQIGVDRLLQWQIGDSSQLGGSIKGGGIRRARVPGYRGQVLAQRGMDCLRWCVGYRQGLGPEWRSNFEVRDPGALRLHRWFGVVSGWPTHCGVRWRQGVNIHQSILVLNPHLYSIPCFFFVLRQFFRFSIPPNGTYG